MTPEEEIKRDRDLAASGMVWSLVLFAFSLATVITNSMVNGMFQKCNGNVLDIHIASNQINRTCSFHGEIMSSGIVGTYDQLSSAFSTAFALSIIGLISGCLGSCGFCVMVHHLRHK